MNIGQFILQNYVLLAYGGVLSIVQLASPTILYVNLIITIITSNYYTEFLYKYFVLIACCVGHIIVVVLIYKVDDRPQYIREIFPLSDWGED